MKKPLKLVRKKETIGSCLGRPKREREREEYLLSIFNLQVQWYSGPLDTNALFITKEKEKSIKDNFFLYSLASVIFQICFQCLSFVRMGCIGTPLYTKLQLDRALLGTGSLSNSCLIVYLRMFCAILRSWILQLHL